MDQRQAMSTMLVSAFSRSKELKSRILFLLGALIIYRIGTHVPLPGINATALEAMQATLTGGVLGMFNTFTGGALSRMSLFVLSVFPYISASIIMMVAKVAVPYLKELSQEGSKGHAVIEQYTKYMAVIISFIQGFGVAKSLQFQEVNVAGEMVKLVADQSLFFPVHIALSIVASTMFLVWLADRMTQKGLYQGLSILIFAGIVATMPTAFAQMFEMNQVGTLSGFALVGLIVWIIIMIGFCCFIESSIRKIPLKNPRALSDAKQGKVDFSKELFFPIKVNPTGVMPVIFGSVVVSGLLTLLTRFPESEIAVDLATYFARGGLLYGLFYAAVIILFAFVMVASMIDTKQQSEGLKNTGSFIPGLRPGKPTQEYLDFVLTRLTVIAAGYLVIVCVLPEFMGLDASIVTQFSGTSVLIMVGVIIGIFDDVQKHIKEQIQNELMDRYSLKKGPRRKVQR